MSTIISMKDFRQTLAAIAEAVGQGESFTVMRRSKPAFVVKPFGDDEEYQWKTALDFTDGGKKKGISAKKLFNAMKKLK